MADKSDPLLSIPASLFSLLSPLESIANGWAGLPFLDVSTTLTSLHHTITHLTLFQVHVSPHPTTTANPSTPLQSQPLCVTR